jgi:plastocyanin
MIRIPIFSLLVSLALLVAGAALADEVTITVGHNRLEPAEVRISAGDTVVFHNVDLMPGGHVVAAVDGSFASPPLGEDERWSHTFPEAGTFEIRIEQHPETKATVIVE